MAGETNHSAVEGPEYSYEGDLQAKENSLVY